MSFLPERLTVVQYCDVVILRGACLKNALDCNLSLRNSVSVIHCSHKLKNMTSVWVSGFICILRWSHVSSIIIIIITTKGWLKKFMFSVIFSASEIVIKKARVRGSSNPEFFASLVLSVFRKKLFLGFSYFHSCLQVKLAVTWACFLAAVFLPSLSLSTSPFICAAPVTRKSLRGFRMTLELCYFKLNGCMLKRDISISLSFRQSILSLN